MSGYAGLATSDTNATEGEQQQEQRSDTSSDNGTDMQMSENDRIVIQSLKDWDLW